MFDWIHNAIENGGELSVKEGPLGQTAMMTWPRLHQGAFPPIYAVKPTTEHALVELDLLLMEDASEEMIKSGVV